MHSILSHSILSTTTRIEVPGLKSEVNSTIILGYFQLSNSQGMDEIDHYSNYVQYFPLFCTVATVKTANHYFLLPSSRLILSCASVFFLRQRIRIPTTHIGVFATGGSQPGTLRAKNGAVH